MNTQAPPAVSDERLDDLIEWHSAFPLNPNGKAVDVCLRELQSLRRVLREAGEALERMQSYAAHLEWCRACAEDSKGSCHEGTELGRAAGMVI